MGRPQRESVSTQACLFVQVSPSWSHDSPDAIRIAGGAVARGLTRAFSRDSGLESLLERQPRREFASTVDSREPSAPFRNATHKFGTVTAL